MKRSNKSQTESSNKLNLAEAISDAFSNAADHITKIIMRELPESLDFTVNIHIFPTWGLKGRLRDIEIRALLNGDTSIVLARMDLRTLLLEDEFYTSEGVETGANAKKAAEMLHSLASEFEQIAKDYWDEEWPKDT